MRTGILFALLGAALVTAGIVLGRAWLALLWPGLAFLVVSAAYLRLGARVLGKRLDGTQRFWVVVLLLPYFFFAWLIWQLLRLFSGVAPYAEVAPGLYVGRRVYARELPSDVTFVVDLTAEFPEARGVLDGRSYRCLPTLDGWVPSDDEFIELVEEIATARGSVFVHCAIGHGRSAAAAAGALIRRGLADDIDAAEAALHRVRPTVNLGAAQRELVRRTTRALTARRA